MPKFKSTINWNKKKKELSDTKKLVPIANEIKADIIQRTQSGKDINERSFKPYSKSYAKTKSTRTVNLTVKQQMLNAIDWKQIKGGIRFYFNSKEQNDKAYENQYKNGRKFFGLSIKDKKAIQKEFQKIYLKALRS